MIEVLVEAEWLPPGLRVWLRPSQLPTPAELGVAEALLCMRCAPGTLLACHGVCVAASAPFQQPAARTFVCATCSALCTLHSMAPPGACCGRELEEVEAARVMVQVGAGRWVGAALVAGAH